MISTYNALVLDDEKDARKLIMEYCRRYAPILGTCFEAETVEEAKEIILNNNISLVFLDVQLKHKSGFELIEEMGGKMPAVIFTTAFQNYAVKAFRASALDYLLKPLNIEDFKEALSKFMNQKTVLLDEIRLNTFRLNMTQPLGDIKRIAIPVKDGFVFEPVNQILYLQGESNYSKVFTSNGNVYVVASTLKSYEELLPSHFQRIHKSYLVNLNYVNLYNKNHETVLVANQIELPVSVRSKGEFLKRF